MRSSKLRRCKSGHCLRPSRDCDACSKHAWTNADARNTPQILRLLATFRIGQVEHAIGQTHHLGVLSVDAIKHRVRCAIERRPPKRDLTLYPYLPSATVDTTDAGNSLSLLRQPALVRQAGIGRSV